jgi:aerobic carbon-monoxide dehydrogenase large subunit
MSEPNADVGDHIGRPVLRREDERLLTGRGRYVEDTLEKSTLFLGFVRSPMARGRILSIDVSPALAIKGVVGVLTGEDLAAVGAPPVNKAADDLTIPAFAALALDHISALGQPVVAVIGLNQSAVRDGCEAVILDIDSEDSVEPSGGGLVTWQSGTPDAAFDDAAHIISVTTRHALVAPAPIEPRSITVTPKGKRLLIYHSTQTPHRTRNDIAKLFGLDPASVQVIAPDVGGAFGGKASLTPEDIAVVAAALKLRRSVAWIATRSEEFLAAPRGRGITGKGRLAIDKRGRMTAMEADFDSSLGWFFPFSAAIPVRNAGRTIPGPYLIKSIGVRSKSTARAMPPVGIYRGAGRPEAAMLIERMVERAAHALGRDPIAFRRAHLIPAKAFPYRTPTGEVLDSGDYAGVLDRLVAITGYIDLKREIAKRRRRGALIGYGVALAIEPCGAGFESAVIEKGSGNRVIVRTGSTSQGQGRETASAQIVASVLGLELDAIDVIHGDTGETMPGIGALASRSTAIGGSALFEAARRFKETGERTELNYTVPAETWASGAALAVTEIDRDTGVIRVENIWFVDDAGRVINPMLVRGQLIGGMVQGLGEALYEQIISDDDGQLLTGSLMDYALPRARDIPPITLASLHTPTTANALGVKGVGEAGTVATPAAILNAIENALSGYDLGELNTPVTSETIWRILSHGRRQT